MIFNMQFIFFPIHNKVFQEIIEIFERIWLYI